MTMISEIRIVVEPWADGGTYKIQARIYTLGDMAVTTQKIYPLDHLKSLFDVIWEDMGKELKHGLEDKNG